MRQIEEQLALEKLMKKFQTEREPFDFQLKQVSHEQEQQSDMLS